SSSSLFLGALVGGTNLLQNNTIINQFRFYGVAVSANVVSALYMTGVIGNCHVFDGAEYVTCPSGAVITGTNDRTVSFWMYLTGYNATAGIFSYGVASTNNAFGMYFPSANGTAYCFGYSNDVIFNTTFSLNTWYHVVITVSSSGTVRKLYVNSVLDHNATTTAINTTSSSLVVGTNQFGVQMTGQLDDFQIWNYALSQTEINYLYAKKDGWQVEEDCDYQKLWIPFDQDYVDKSGNQNLGVITGTETYVAGAVPFADGRLNKAFSFNGSSSINFSDTPPLNPTSAISI